VSPGRRAVAVLIGQGCCHEENARHLSQSVLTVKKQRRSIDGKLEITNRGRPIALMC
jgi:DNA-binding NarL/FixJ family response regulator